MYITVICYKYRLKDVTYIRALESADKDKIQVEQRLKDVREKLRQAAMRKDGLSPPTYVFLVCEFVTTESLKVCALYVCVKNKGLSPHTCVSCV